MKRLWKWLTYKPYSAFGKNFRSEEAMSKYVWKKALEA